MSEGEFVSWPPLAEYQIAAGATDALANFYAMFSDF